jgi:hypothetical protein
MVALRTVLSTGFLPPIFKIYFLGTPRMNALDQLRSHAEFKAGRSYERQITIHQERRFLSTFGDQ